MINFIKKLFCSNDKRIIDEFKDIIEQEKQPVVDAAKAVNDQITDSVTQKPKKPRVPRKKKVE